MPSAPSQRSDPVLDKRAGPAPVSMRKRWRGCLRSPWLTRASCRHCFLETTPQQHPAGGPDVYRGPWSGGGGLGKIKQTTKASRVGGSPLLNS